MTRAVFISEIPVAYRHGWFSYLREHSDVDVRVLYLAGSQSDRPWEAAVDEPSWCRVLPGRSIGSSDTGFFPRVTPSIGRSLAQEKPDFVLLPGWAHPTSWHAAMWCKRNKVPYGVMFENWKAQSKTSIPSKVTDRVRETVLGGAAVALPAGLRAAEFAATITDAPIHVLHANVADVDAAGKAVADVERSGRRRVLYLGRLMPHKGIDIVLDMAESLAKVGITLDVAGDGPSKEAVEQAARRGSLEYHGTVVGDAKYELMARSSMVIVPSFEEPWGVVVHEALACGRPVLASAEVGCTTEFIEAGVTGAILGAERGAFEATIRSWAENVIPDAAACFAKAETVTYGSVTAEFEAIVTEVCP
ncbi:MAG: glycosyltransferase [Acidimicrobiia bacterium]|nr:glycosyltransferase [Acidimicrobiia bacterium]